MSKVEEQNSETGDNELKKVPQIKLDEDNSSIISEGIRISNDPIDGLFYVNFNKEAAIVTKFDDPEKAKKAELDGQARVDALVEKMRKFPSPDEIKKLLKNSNL